MGGRTVTNLRFANDLYPLSEEEEELEALGGVSTRPA